MKINKVLIAITVGMVVSWGGQVEGKPDDPFIKKSDVFFTQPRWDEMEAENQGKYSDYGVDATMWGFLPPTYPSFNFQTTLNRRCLVMSMALSIMILQVLIGFHALSGMLSGMV